MTREQLQALANETLEAHGVVFMYTVKLSPRKLTGGYVRHDKSLIVVSSHAPEAAQRNTLLHECAHVIAFRKFGHRGHGWKWRSVARQVGASDVARSAPMTEALQERRAKTHLEVRCEKCKETFPCSKRRWERYGLVLRHTQDGGALTLAQSDVV